MAVTRRMTPATRSRHIVRADHRSIRPHQAMLLVTALCAIGIAARMLLDPVLMDRATFLFFVPPVIVGAAFGGRIVGLFGILLGTASGLMLEKVTGAFVDGSIIAALSYIAVSVPLAIGGNALRRARMREIEIVGELGRREALLSSILQTVPDAMIVIDQGGLIRDFSPTAEHQFGWAVAEVIGQDVTMLMPARYRARHLGNIQRYLRTRKPHVIGIGREVTGLRKDGSTFPIELAVGELDLPEGRFFTGFVRDISERQKAETRLQEVQNELVHVSRLTALGEMATALAHELNQPLSAIGNYLLGSKALLRRDVVPHERVAEAVDLAAREALRAGEIIRRIREFVSRGETERWAEHLPRLIRDTIALALVESKHRGIEVRYDLDPQVEWVMVNKVQVQQVLLNLIRNATDAMRDATTRVLDIAVLPEGEGFARICVSDTGPGIDPNVQDELFRPFITTKETGLGVGLSICRTIIEGHGGEVGAQNRASGGASFHVTLPMAAAREPYERA